MKLTCCCGASIECDKWHEVFKEFIAIHANCVAMARHLDADVFATKRDKRAIAELAENARKTVDYYEQMLENMRMDADDSKAPDLGPRTCATEAPYIDPYARFRDAIREGKRVFRKANGGLYAIDQIVVGMEFADLFIEGIDIPFQPTQKWLDAHGVELTGECRQPFSVDEWAPNWFSNVVQHGCVTGDKYDPFSGRRWIVRKVKKDDGFEKWWSEEGHDFYKIAWTAAQEAKK